MEKIRLSRKATEPMTFMLDLKDEKEICAETKGKNMPCTENNRYKGSTHYI